MRYYVILILFFIGFKTLGQEYVLDNFIPKYGNRIEMDSNKLIGADKSPSFNNFFSKLDSIYIGKKEKLHIFHIGGSHIQADIYSNKLRTYFQNMNAVSMGQRGFVFPFQLAHTNNPTNYSIKASKDKWKGYRNSVLKDSIAWGLAGVTAAFRDCSDTIYINANYKNNTKENYTFDKLRIFYNTWKEDYKLTILDSNLVVSETLNDQMMYREFQLSSAVASLKMSIQIKDTTTINPEFLMMGIEFMNNNPGIEYTSIGVNGASFGSYNRSAFFEKQLLLYKPDLFIISVGTNDAYKPQSEFKEDEYRMNYEAFIQMIQRVNPNCAILLTVPNDNYYKKKYPNKNTAVQEQIILQLAEKYNMATWNLYEIMGGLGSSYKWYRNKLMRSDRIHFTYLGYSLKADLLLNALVNSWANCTNRNPKTLLNQFKMVNE
ncbi:GDSL-type esterase/lipase family protein [uncultured Polaribacter sp.]|uniref:GDSL-type esterase/lipase family protein n=1 Tax=uncultured Polaribacter sp. TaxID=174711 RepID=UPI0030DA0573|tara:strand:+ start:232 stop:1527 length:1296 start_codon:yes stop_codon:yes gene_type:complete